MTQHLTRHVIDLAAEELFRFAANQMSPEEMGAYQEKYRDIVLGYRNSDLKIFSSIKLDIYEPFIKWLPWLIENKEKVVPILVNNMLRQDIYALTIYNILQQKTAGEDLLLDSFMIRGNEDLYAKYKAAGAGQPAIAFINAINWLDSDEAANIVINSDLAHSSHEATNNLCVINGILGISNSHIDCSEHC